MYGMQVEARGAAYCNNLAPTVSVQSQRGYGATPKVSGRMAEDHEQDSSK